ncbi:MAG: Yip1 family protein [Casimicrobiaceae bacterium]
MGIVDRVKNIIVAPRTEWPRIAEEPATVGSIFTGYVLVLAAIGPLALAIRSPGIGLSIAIVSYLVSLGITYVLALIVDSLAPTFGGEKGMVGSMKLVAYAYTVAWLAGILRLIPILGAILVLAATIYAFYTFYLGVPVLRKAAPEKAAGFTIVVVICGLVLGFLVSGLVFSAIFGGAMMAGMGMMQ